MPDAARELAEAGAAYAEQPDDGQRPNPALQGDAQDGAESRVSAEREVGDEGEDLACDDGGGGLRAGDQHRGDWQERAG